MANEIQELKFQVGEVWKGVYSSSTAYGLANVVQDPTGLSIYRSLKSGNVGHPLSNASWWFRIIDLSSIKAESDRIAALNQAIAQDEALRVAAEELRQQHEAERVAAETQRNEAEQQRISAEQARVNAESARATAEQQRITAEQGRVSAESARVQAEQARVLAETLRANAEDQRAANEQNRVAAEQQRIERAEQDHQRAESDHATYVDSLGAFDISSYHATDGVQAKYADLTAALGTGGANIPEAIRKGGMSVKFVQSSDNKYVQYRLMSDEWSTTVTDWQGVDDEPTAESDNLVKSGGVKTELNKIDSKFGVEIQKTKSLDTTTANQFILTAEEGHSKYITGKVVFTVDNLDIDHITNIYFGVGDLNLSPGSMQYLNTGSGNNNKFKTGFSVVLFDDPNKRLEGVWVRKQEVPSDCTLTCTISSDGVEQRLSTVESELSLVESNVSEIKDDSKIVLGNGISKVGFNVSTADRFVHIMTEEETYPLNLCGKVHFRIDDISIDNIPNGGSAIYFGYKNKITEQMTYLNLGSINNYGSVVDKFDWVLFDDVNYQLSGMWIDTNYIPSGFTLSFTVYSEGTYIGNRKLMSFIPKFVALFRDNSIPYTSTRDNIRIYPHNMIDVDDTDYSIGVCVIGKRSGEKMVVPQVADTKYPVDIINFDGKIYRAGYITPRVAVPTAPSNDLFILTIGDSLMFGANMSYHGCINNELSRLFNGIGKAIANGAEPLGYNNIHVIGTLDSNYGSVSDAPIKHEGRGGWTVGMYLTQQADNAFYNPNKVGDVKFDLDYYLSQNGFYNDGVAQDGSNLIIPIMLNWNSDPEQDSYIDNYRLLIEDIHTSHPNARIMLMGCNCPPREILATYNDTYIDRYSQLQAITKRRAILYEQKLEALADDYLYCVHVPIMPFYNWQNSYIYYDSVRPTPRDSSNILRVYADYVHPNLMGYGQIADILFNAISYYYLTT